MSTRILYDRKRPFFAKVKQRYILNKAGSSKKTYHISLDINGSGIEYKPGDSIGIIPENDPLLVESILDFFGSKDPLFKDFLIKKANLLKIPPKLLKDLNLSIDEEAYDIPLFLEIFKPQISPETFCSYLLPMLPRFYSVASSMQIAKDEVHLLVSTFNYTLQGRLRAGIASEFLCKRDREIPLYVQETKHFKIPKEDVPIIMVGTGTGIAPYRGFMQERTYNKNWLFFGERHAAFDFYYEEKWKDLEKRGMLRISTAFSRDQKEKIYVQDRLLEEAQTLWQWIQDGAIIYLCGDAKRMAKDVTKTLEIIFEKYGNIDPKAFLKTLRQEKRFCIDVY